MLWGKAHKKAFSLLELIVIIFIMSILVFFVLKNNSPNELKMATDRMVLYLKQTRLQAMIDNKYENSNGLWHKQRWTLKFFRCRSSVGGIYYVIYSDNNQTGHPNLNESLKDPLTKKQIYSSNYCKENSTSSPYVLLTHKFNISSVSLSCNSTTSLGQLSFGSDGRVYSKLSNEENEFYEYEINEPCTLTITHKNGDSKSIIIENSTGYIYLK